jgi:hypothetical protein
MRSSASAGRFPVALAFRRARLLTVGLVMSVLLCLSPLVSQSVSAQAPGGPIDQSVLVVSGLASDPDIALPEAVPAFQLIAPSLLMVALVFVTGALLSQTTLRDRLPPPSAPVLRPRLGRYSRPVLNAFLN